MNQDGVTRKQFLASLSKGMLGMAACSMAGAAGKPAAAENTTLRLEPAGSLEPPMKAVHGVAIDAKDRMFVAGAEGIMVFSAKRQLEQTIKTAEPAVAVAVDPEGFIYAAHRESIDKFDPAGRRLKAWGDRADEPGRLRYATGIAAGAEWVYVTDSGARKVLRYAADGDFADDIEGPNAAEGQKFIIPSAFFDCKLDGKGVLHVGHTGMHRVERYADNKLIGHWGRFGSDAEGFCGCCNPTNLALLPGGRVATSEKGVPRLKVHDGEGKLLACLGAEAFPGNTAGMALAVTAGGRIALAEPVSRAIRFYELVQRA